MSDDLSNFGGSSVATRPASSGSVNGEGANGLSSSVMAMPAQSAPVEAQLITGEVAGDAPVPGEEAAGDDADLQSPTATESQVFEASADQLESAESGEESALTDLQGVPGFEGLAMPTATESDGEQVPLLEAGTEVEGVDPEFFGAIAALAPTLISAVGPTIARAVTSKLSPRAKRVITSRPRPAPAPGPRPANNIDTILRLLQQALAKPGGESSAEVESMMPLVEEAAAALEVIIGKDDRVRITRTSDIPWRRICALRITFPGGTYRGTGFLIGPRTVVTAGHCVYLHGKGWAQRIEVIPGSNGTDRPFGSVTSSQFRSVSGWVNGRKPAHDYGCIVLPNGAFGGKNLGSFGYASLPSQQLLAATAVLAGYPGDKPFAEMWGMARRIKTVTNETLIYDIDTMGGQSGSCVYVKVNGQRVVVGIHNYGASSGNSATRITASVKQRLDAWRAI